MALNAAGLNKQLRQGVGRLYLLAGEETFLHGVYVSRIREKTLEGDFADWNYTVLEGKEARFDELAAQINTYPNMAPVKMVVAKNTPFLTGAEHQKAMGELLARIPDYAVLVFVEEDLKKVKKELLRALEAHGAVAELTRQSASDLRAWVGRTLAAEGKRMRDADAEHLVNLCERSLERLSTECAKLIAAAGDRETVSRELIDDHVHVPLEYKIFAMSDLLLSGDAATAYAMLGEFKTAKEQPTVILSLIYSQLSMLYMFRSLRGEAERFLPANRRFLARRLSSECMRHDGRMLREAMRGCAQADEEIKTGRTEGWTALEMICARLLTAKK